MCVLRLVDNTQEPKPQDNEVAEAVWKPLDEFLGSKWYAKGLYGDMLRTAAGTAQRVQQGEVNKGLNVVKMPSLGGREESLYFQGPLLSNL